MINREPSSKDLIHLWNICAHFIEYNDISSRENVYQTDRVIESAYGFIAQICDQVGYVDYDDEEDDEEDDE